jgi:hypothetical protein
MLDLSCHIIHDRDIVVMMSTPRPTHVIAHLNEGSVTQRLSKRSVSPVNGGDDRCLFVLKT